MTRWAFVILLLLTLALAGLEVAALRLEPAANPIEAGTALR
jgi:hypothetical protein